MREAVIVSTARTPLTKSHRGEFNITPAAQLAAFSVKAAVERSGVDPEMIEDLILGCGNPDGFQGRNFTTRTASLYCRRTKYIPAGISPSSTVHWLFPAGRFSLAMLRTDLPNRSTRSTVTGLETSKFARMVSWP